MSTVEHRTQKTGIQSLFFQDLATPVSSRRSGGKFSTPGQEAAVSALWLENFNNSELPPPPVFTLEDRSETAAVSALWRENFNNSDLPPPPVFTLEDRSGTAAVSALWRENFNNSDLPPPPVFTLEDRSEAAAVSALWRENFNNSDLPPPPVFTLEDRSDFSPESEIPDYPASPGVNSDPRTPVRSTSREFSTRTLPPPREVARPETKKNVVPVGNLDEEEWVTVYGFSPADNNLVLREFEECGVILKHVPGPGAANWMHILYQNRSDAQKALRKNGMQLKLFLIIGVKSVDPIQCQALNERLNNQGFMPLLPAPLNRTPESRF